MKKIEKLWTELLRIDHRRNRTIRFKQWVSSHPCHPRSSSTRRGACRSRGVSVSVSGTSRCRTCGPRRAAGRARRRRGARGRRGSRPRGAAAAPPARPPPAPPRARPPPRRPPTRCSRASARPRPAAACNTPASYRNGDDPTFQLVVRSHTSYNILATLISLR